MSIRPNLTAAALGAAIFLALAAGSPAAQAYSCEAQVNQALQLRGVSQADVQSVKVTRRTGGARSASIYSLDAWVRLNSCSNGAVVVNLTKYCMVKQVYTTGDCRSGEIPSY